MNKAKSKWWFVPIGVGAGVLTYTFWPQPLRPVILYAYSDNAFSMWGLTLYKDGRFYMTLPAAYEKGRFLVFGDTIEFQYDNPAANQPAAYFINRDRNKIEELRRVAGKWTVTHNGNWAGLHYDSTRYYSR